MKTERKKIINKAMSLIIRDLEVDASFLSHFQTAHIFDATSVEDILVSSYKWNVYDVSNVHPFSTSLAFQ